MLKFTFSNMYFNNLGELLGELQCLNPLLSNVYRHV